MDRTYKTVDLSSGRQSPCGSAEFTTFCRISIGGPIQGTIILASSRAFVAGAPDGARQADRHASKTGEGALTDKLEATLL
jgi:hypothetical protein